MRSNKEQSFNINRIGRYAIRKLSIGAASVLIGITFAIGGPQLVKADTEPASEQVIKTDSDQSEDEDNNEQNADATDTDQDIDINLPDNQQDKASKQTSEKNKSTDNKDITSADKDDVLEIKTDKSAPKNKQNNNELTSNEKNTPGQSNKAIEQKLNIKNDSEETQKGSTSSSLNQSPNTETLSLKSLGKSPKLSADQLFGAKFEIPSISVSNKAEFENAILSAPTDGTEKLIKLINDINLENDLIEIKNGQNIVITNDGQQRKIMIGNQIHVANGGHLKFKAKQKDGIVITRPNGENPSNTHLVSALNGYENYWSVLDAVGKNAQLTLDNVEVTGFHYIYTNQEGLSDQADTEWWRINTNEEGDPGQYVGIITIKNGAKFDFLSSEIDHNIIYDYVGTLAGWSTALAGSLALHDHAVCNMTNSKIDNNQLLPNRLVKDGIVPYSYDTAGALVYDATLIAKQSEIANNSGGTVGGIFAFNSGSATDHTIVELHATDVLNNQGYTYAGGIFFFGAGAGKLDAQIDQGSKIKGNACGDRNLNYSPFMKYYSSRTPLMGGGMSVSDGVYDGTRKQKHIVHLVIDGASISNNFSIDTGGGIYVDTDGVVIKKAVIANNVSKFGRGGGIYVSVAPYELKLNNTVIFDNHAVAAIDPDTGRPYWFATGSDNQEMAGSGGGIWLCPTGHASIKITNGIAIFDNHADFGGDELWNEHKNPGVTAIITDRILGGGDANWTHDRDSLNGQKFIGPAIGNNVGLKSHVSKDAKDLAKALATVWIYGNTAAWGGGVGSNGGIITNANHDQDEQNKDITITKHWVDNNDPERPTSVTIDVIATYKGSDYLVTSFKLSDKNNWTYQLTDLPTNITYDFVEDATGLDINGDGQADYTESNGKVTFVRTLGDTSYYALTITNTKKTGNTPTPTPGGSQPTEPQPTQPQPSNPQPTMPQPSAPQPTKPQTSNIPVHPNKTPKKPKSNITISTNTGKTSSHTPIKSFKSVSHQNKVIQYNVVSSHKQPNKPKLPQTGNKKSGLFLTGLGMIILAGLAGALVDHKRRI